jgi:Bacterial PH domain
LGFGNFIHTGHAQANLVKQARAERVAASLDLGAGEEVRFAVSASRRGRDRGVATQIRHGSLVVTDRRLVFRSRWGRTVETITLDSIDSAESRSRDWVGADLVLQIGEREQIFRCIQPPTKADDIATLISGQAPISSL